MAGVKPSQLVFTYRGVEFNVLGSREVERTSIIYHLYTTGSTRVLQAFITCSMKHKINDAANTQREAWDFMMWDLVSATAQQSLIRYVQPELTRINDDVSLRTLRFHAPSGEPSRLFYISTGEERGVYVLAMDDDILCPDEELIRQLLKKYALRTLYEPLNANQKPPPLAAQDLDEECTLQRLLPTVFTSATDLDGDGPLFLTTVLAAVHYIIVQLDAWRGINQFYKCKNELRLRKVTPSVDGNRIMIKEEGDVLYIILPLDCAKQRFCDVLLAALHGYAAYIFTKMLTDVMVPGGVLPNIGALQAQALAAPRSMSLLSLYRVEGGQRVRLATDQQQQDWWAALTIDAYNYFYAGTNDLLAFGYKPAIVRRIPLYCYADTQHDLPEIEALESSPYRKAVASTVEKMESLRLRLQSVNSDLIESWAIESRQIIQEYPNNYLGIFDKDSRFQEKLTFTCPAPVAASITTDPQTKKKKRRQREEEGEVMTDSRLQYEKERLPDINYRQIKRESALFSLYSNEDHVLDRESLERAARFLEENGFVILTDDYFEEQSLEMVSKSLNHEISRLYVGKAAGSFPVSRGLCQLDLEPLVYDAPTWNEIRGNEMLFESFRGVVEQTEEGEHWKKDKVRLPILPPSTTYKKSGSTRQFRIHWRLESNPASPYMGMVTVDDMSKPEYGGLVLAPGFHKQASTVYDRILADEMAKIYYYKKEHLHTFPFRVSDQDNGVPPLIKDILVGHPENGRREQVGLLQSLSFLPLQPGDLVLWSENMPHSWLRSSNSGRHALGQMYSLSSAEVDSVQLEQQIAKGQLPYKPEGRQKKEIRVQENSKPRNSEWIWLNWSPDPKQSEVKKMRDAGWKWVAAEPHDNTNTYNSRWIYDAKNDRWIKNRMDKLEFPASYNYCTFFCSRDPDTQKVNPSSERLREFIFGTTFGSTALPCVSHHRSTEANGTKKKKRRRMASSATAMLRSTANGGEREFTQFMDRTASFLQELNIDLDSVERGEEEEEEEGDDEIVEALSSSLEELRDSNLLTDAKDRSQVIDFLETNVLTLFDATEWDEALLDTVGEPSEILDKELAELHTHVQEFIDNERNEVVRPEVIAFRPKVHALVNELIQEMESLDVPPGVKGAILADLRKLPDSRELRNFGRLEDVLNNLYSVFRSGREEILGLSPQQKYEMLRARQRIHDLRTQMSELTQEQTDKRRAEHMLRSVDEVLDFIRALVKQIGLRDLKLSKPFTQATAPLYDKGFAKEKVRTDAVFERPAAVRERVAAFIQNAEELIRPFQERAFAQAAQLALNTLKEEEEEPGEVVMEVEEEEEESDPLTEIQRSLPRMEELVTTELNQKRWTSLRNQILERLGRVSDTIQKTGSEQAVASQLKSLIGGLGKRIAAEQEKEEEKRNQELITRLEKIQAELILLRKFALVPAPPPKEEEVVIVVPETPSPPPVAAPKEKKKKRKRTPPVSLEKEPSVEEQLQPHGVDPLVVRSVLRLVDFQRYTMSHRVGSSEEEVSAGTTDSGTVEYRQDLDRIDIEFTLQRGSLRLSVNDKLALFFSDKLVARATVTNSFLAEQSMTLRLITESGAEETVLLKLTSTPRGEILAVSWFVQLNTLIHLLAVLGPRPTKRVRKEKESKKKKKTKKRVTTYVDTLFEELDLLAAKLQTTLDPRVPKPKVIAHITFRAAVNQLLAARRQNPDTISLELVEKAKEEQEKLLRVIKKLDRRAEEGSRTKQVYTEALEDIAQAGTLLNKLKEWQETLPEKLEGLQELREMEAVLQPPFESEAMQKVAQNIGAAREMLEARIQATTEKESKTNILNRYFLDSLQLLEPEESELAGELRGLIQAFVEKHKKNLISRIRRKSPKGEEEEISAAQEMETLQIEPEPEPEAPATTTTISIAPGGMKRTKERKRLKKRSSPTSEVEFA